MGNGGDGGADEPTKGELSPPTPGGEDPSLGEFGEPGGGGPTGLSEYGEHRTEDPIGLMPFGQTPTTPVTTAPTLGVEDSSVIPGPQPGDVPVGGGFAPDVGPDTIGPTGGGPAEPEPRETTKPTTPEPKKAEGDAEAERRRRLRSLLTGYEDPYVKRPTILGGPLPRFWDTNSIF